MCTGNPRVVQADPGACEEAIVRVAVDALTAGELVVFPTDTVYGLACRADDEAAVRRLFAAKRRPLQKALPLLLPCSEALAQAATGLEEAAWALAFAFWPGALTLVVSKSPLVSDLVTGGLETVGVRVPDLPLARGILSGCPFPVAATSANFSDEDPACAVEELPEGLLAEVALVVDGGRCLGAVPSTVVTAAGEVLREGPVTAEEINTVLRGERRQ